MASTLGFRIFMDDAEKISRQQREATKQLGDRAYSKKDFSSVMVRPSDDGIWFINNWFFTNIPTLPNFNQESSINSRCLRPGRN